MRNLVVLANQGIALRAFLKADPNRRWKWIFVNGKPCKQLYEAEE